MKNGYDIIGLNPKRKNSSDHSLKDECINEATKAYADRYYKSLFKMA